MALIELCAIISGHSNEGASEWLGDDPFSGDDGVRLLCSSYSFNHS